MQDLRSIETNVLIDMLATHTALYLKLGDGDGSETEYAKCILTIRALQTEIETRKLTGANSSNSDPNIVIN